MSGTGVTCYNGGMDKVLWDMQEEEVPGVALAKGMSEHTGCEGAHGKASEAARCLGKGRQVHVLGAQGV